MATMNDTDINTLRDANARRPLNGTEEAQLRAYLAAHPEFRQAWEEDFRLTSALRRLPDAPLASNFTAQVMSAVHRTEARQRERRRRTWLRWFFAQALRWETTTATMVLALGWLTVLHLQARHRAEVAQGAAAVVRIAALPPMRFLQDFDSIKNLPPASWQKDMELLGAVQ